MDLQLQKLPRLFFFFFFSFFNLCVIFALTLLHTCFTYPVSSRFFFRSTLLFSFFVLISQSQLFFSLNVLFKHRFMPPPCFFQQASFIPNSTSMLLSQAASTQHNVSSTSIIDLYLLCLDYRFIFSLFCMGNQEFLFWPGIRFWLRVFLILVESVPNFFLKAKKNIFFQLLYIIFFFKSGCSWEHLRMNVAPPLVRSLT